MPKKVSATLGAALLLFSTLVFAHGTHSHGTPLTEVERLANEGIFDDNSVQDRALSDWDGVWESLYPHLLAGDLDPVLQQKAKKGDKTLEAFRDYYKKGYATDIDMIGIENNVIEFHRGEKIDACAYRYSGYQILHYATGKKGVRYLFECNEANSKAPRFVQFSDHMITARQSQHFHIFMGNDSQEALLKEMDNWPTYYPYTLSKAQIIDEMLHH